MKRLIINFTGTKEELHKQLKTWCVKAEKSMSKTVISLIENKLKNEKSKQKNKKIR